MWMGSDLNLLGWYMFCGMAAMAIAGWWPMSMGWLLGTVMRKPPLPKSPTALAFPPPPPPLLLLPPPPRPCMRILLLLLLLLMLLLLLPALLLLDELPALPRADPMIDMI